MPKSNAGTASPNWEKYRYHWDKNLSLDASLYHVGDNAMTERVEQKEFMIEAGLKPHHKFLDLGCGCLRGTIDLVDYLEEDNFYGCDVSQHLIDRGKEQAPKANLKVNDDFDLKTLFPGVKFDYILSVSVLTHLFKLDIEALFKGVSEVLVGTYYFTLYPADSDLEGIPFAAYRKDWIIEAGKCNGLKIEDVEGHFENKRAHALIPVVNTKLGQWVMKATPLNK